MAEVEQEMKPELAETLMCVEHAEPAPYPTSGARADADGHSAARSEWWRGYQAGRESAGRDREPAVRAPEPRGKWSSEHEETKSSFSDLLNGCARHALAWFDKGRGEEPPPQWVQAIQIFGPIVASAMLGGLSNQVTVHLLDEFGAAADLLVGAALRSGILTAEGTIRETVHRSATSGGGDRDAAVRLYAQSQHDAMVRAGVEARRSFALDKAGDFDDQRLSIAEMRAIRETNTHAVHRARDIVDREMLLGWAAILAGDTHDNPPSHDIEDIDHAGILRLTIAGRADRATGIRSARIEGLNPALRASLSGRTLSEIRPGRRLDPAEQAHLAPRIGLDIVLTTPPDGFGVTHLTWRRLRRAGRALAHPHSPSPNLIWFSVFMERSGRFTWADADAAWQIDLRSGAAAGRWFLAHIRTPNQLLDDLDETPLPEVTT